LKKKIKTDVKYLKKKNKNTDPADDYTAMLLNTAYTYYRVGYYTHYTLKHCFNIITLARPRIIRCDKRKTEKKRKNSSRKTLCENPRRRRAKGNRGRKSTIWRRTLVAIWVLGD